MKTPTYSRTSSRVVDRAVGLVYTRSVSAIVLIGPVELLPSLSERVRPQAKEAKFHSFTSGQATEALEFIRRHRPPVVALEQEFSSTPAGIVLQRRLERDSSLAACDVRIVSVETASPRKTSGAGVGVARAEVPAVAIQPEVNSTRRVARIRMTDNLIVTVDGNPAVLVDLSAQGAQLLSAVVLRPNQRVRLAFTESESSVRCAGAVQWASFEMPVGKPPRYRAGVRFSSGDPDALIGYAERHKLNGSD